MKTVRRASRAAVLVGLAMALAAMACAQSAPSGNSPPSTPPSDSPTAQPAPGTMPVGGDTPATAPSKQPAPGTTPAKGDTPAATVNPDKVIEPGSQKINVKPGSIDDVNAVGNRDIGGRGFRNFYSTDTEIKMGRTYAMQIEKSTRFITDPVVTEYVN
ncbi:MAG: peptidase M48, partial [Terracidiphilus sp.]